MKVRGVRTSLTGLVIGWEEFPWALEGAQVAGDPAVAPTTGPWSNLTWSVLAILRFERSMEGRAVRVAYRPQKGPSKVCRCPIPADTAAMRIGREDVILGGLDEEGASVPVEVIHRVRLYFPGGFHLRPYPISVCRVPLARYSLVREGLLGESTDPISDAIVAIGAYECDRRLIAAVDPVTGRGAALEPFLPTLLY